MEPRQGGGEDGGKLHTVASSTAQRQRWLQARRAFSTLTQSVPFSSSVGCNQSALVHTECWRSFLIKASLPVTPGESCLETQLKVALSHPQLTLRSTLVERGGSATQSISDCTSIFRHLKWIKGIQPAWCPLGDAMFSLSHAHLAQTASLPADSLKFSFCLQYFAHRGSQQCQAGLHG